jgi:endo-1,4-beta-xylanase
MKNNRIWALTVSAVILMTACAGLSKKPDITITFDTDGGSPELNAITIKQGSAMGEKYPAVSTKLEYAFDGWYDGTTLYTKDTQVHGDITLKAKWITVGEANTLTLIIGEKRDLKPRITKPGMTGKTLTWSSSDSKIAMVKDGVVIAEGFSAGGTSTVSSEATGSVTITATTADGNLETFTIKTTMASQANMMTLPPLKDQFAPYFLLGNIATQSNYSTGTSGTITDQRLTRHYNVLTAENHMKPDSFSANNGYNAATGVITYTWTNPDNFVNAATNSGFKILGHVLLWHSQIPQWQKDLGTPGKKDEALAAMKRYITEVMGRYAGKIWAWDVLNEIFPDGVNASADWKTVMRKTGDSQGPNPWYMAIGADFVYEGYKAARLADPNAILYYNDYNLDSTGKATMVRNMVRDVNEQWKNDSENKEKNRLLIEGIGMQSHHNTGVSANSIRNTLNLFRPLGVRISISELDVLCMSYSSFSGSTGSGTNKSANSIATNSQKLQAANLYGDYMKLFIQNADIIDRVSFWGVYDEQSWRSGGLPLLFEGSSASIAKPAYFRLVGALE